MWQYNHVPDSDELMHYGVVGMRWGRRKAMYKERLNLKRAAGASTYNRQKKFLKKAQQAGEEVNQYTAKIEQHKKNKKQAKLNKISKNANESAREWDQMAKYAESKGKTKKAAKYRANAAKDRKDAKNPAGQLKRQARNKAIARGALAAGIGVALAAKKLNKKKTKNGRDYINAKFRVLN